MPKPFTKNLEQYIADQNSWNKIFNGSQVTWPLDQAGVDSVSRMIDGALSPENLHCDGEISPDQARKKAEYLYAVGAELRALVDSRHGVQLNSYEF